MITRYKNFGVDGNETKQQQSFVLSLFSKLQWLVTKSLPCVFWAVWSRMAKYMANWSRNTPLTFDCLAACACQLITDCQRYSTPISTKVAGFG